MLVLLHYFVNLTFDQHLKACTCCVLQGRGSSWQDSLVLSASGTTISGSTASNANPIASVAASAAAARKAGDFVSMEPSEVARIFEERLADALLGKPLSLQECLSNTCALS